MKLRAAWLTLLVTAASALAQTYNFSRLTGVPSAGLTDGAATAASFNQPFDVAIDGAGNVFVADYANHVIRKITAAGVVSTLAGVAGTRGRADGAGAVARFNFPRSITVDPAGNVYVLDDATIRKITAAGVVSTLAGRAGEPGSQDGPGSVARFSFGSNGDGGIEADRDGTLYVADTGNHTIRKITPDGMVSTFAGGAGQIGAADGVGGAARFNYPLRLTLDRAGNVWVSDSRGWIFDSNELLGAIRRITPAGVVTTVARTLTPSKGIAVDRAGIVYVTNSFDGDGNGYSTISRITPKDGVTLLVGANGDYPVPRDGSGSQAAFLYPEGLALDENDNLIVADTRNHAIRRVTPAGQVTTIAGLLPASIDGGRDEARFQLAVGNRPLATDSSGFVYLADDYVIRKIAPDGSVTTLAGRAGERGNLDGTGSAARLGIIGSLIIDRAGNLFARDDSGGVRKISPTGVVTTLAVEGRSNVLAVDSLGALYYVGQDFTALPILPVLKKVTPQGAMSVVFGADRNGGPRLTSFASLAIDSRDNLYLGESSGIIRKITPDGAVTTFAGRADIPQTERSLIDGSLAEARFVSPGALAVDGADNLFVSDAGVLRKISNGVVTTFFVGPFAANTVYGWAVDRSGNLYTTSGQTVLKGVVPAAGDPQSRLSNASILANLDRQRPLIVGFNIAGAAQSVLLRAIGPGLRDFASGLTLAGDPRVDVYGSTGAMIGSNDDWRGDASLAAAFRAVGAFPLLANSTDSALMQTVSGTTTVHIRSATTGDGLVEVFALGAGEAARIVNLSARDVIGGDGDSSMTLGFTITGPNGKSLLIRGVGPALAAPPFAVSPALSGGELSVYSASGEQLARQFGSSAPIIPIIAARVGAFQLPVRTGDPSIVLTLEPGSYTAVLSPAFRATPGEAMIEIYEVR